MSERTPYQEAYDLVSEDAYEYASEEGYIRWMSATRIDPGCWDRDLDVNVNNFMEDAEIGGWTAEVNVYLGQTLLLERYYSFYLVGAYMHRDFEDA
jgi:hypothetical protein